MQVWPTAVGTVPTTASSSWRIWRFRPVYKELIRPRCVTPSNASSLWDRFDTFPLPVTNTFAQFSVTCAVTVWFMFRICVRKGEMCWLRSWDTWWIKRCSPRQLPLKRLCCGWMWGHTHIRTDKYINMDTFTRWCWIFLTLCLFLRRFWVRQRETRVAWSWRSTRGEKNTAAS